MLSGKGHVDWLMFKPYVYVKPYMSQEIGIFFCNPILFAICTSIFSKLCTNVYKGM
jgi:hypothetical protein